MGEAYIRTISKRQGFSSGITASFMLWKKIHHEAVFMFPVLLAQKENYNEWL